MAEEIGTGYVSLVPSLKGFSKKTERELRRELRGGIEVPVRPVLEKDSLNIDVDPNAKAFHARLAEMIHRAAAGVHAQVPVEPGDHKSYVARLKAFLLRTRETQHVKVDVDKNNLRSVSTKAEQSGSLIGRLFSAGFQGGLLSPVGITAILTAVIVALPFAGGLIAATTIAGAGIAALLVGGFLLAGDKQLKDAATTLFSKIGKGLKEAVKPLKGPFLTALQIIGTQLKRIAPDVRDFFKTIADSGGIEELARGIGGLITSLVDTGALKNLANAIGPMLKQIGMALPDIGNALSQFIISITRGGNTERAADFMGKFLRTLADIIRLLGTIVGFLLREFPAMLRALRAIWSVTKILFSFMNPIFNAVREVVGWFIRGGMVLSGVLASNGAAIIDLWTAVKDLPSDIGHLFEWLWRKIRGVTSNITGLAKSLPGRITSALGNTGRLLLQAGKNVVQGLIDGIKSKLASLGSIARSVAQTIRDYLPFSPAKTGPLSGSGNPFHSGQVIASDLAGGVASQLPTVRSAAAGLAGQFGLGGPTLAGVGAGAGFTIDTAGSRLDDLLLEVLAQAIRDKFGGDVDLAIGKKRRR